MLSQKKLDGVDREGIDKAADLMTQDGLTYSELEIVKQNLLKLLKKYKIDVNSPYGQAWMETIKKLQRGLEDAYDRAMKGL